MVVPLSNLQGGCDSSVPLVIDPGSQERGRFSTVSSVLLDRPPWVGVPRSSDDVLGETGAS